MAAALLAVCSAAMAADLPLHAIAAPHYGDTLFRFYQDHYFDAITSLMVSQHFGRIAPHDDEAEVLRGGLMLSYGLHDEAAAIFAQLIERQAAPSVRDRAWFYLARIRHQRGLAADAEIALARINAPLPGALEEERQLLRAQLLLQRQDYTGAAAVLEPLRASASAGLYARFNLGVALIRSGDAERGNALLDEVGLAPGANEEVRSLRDRANLALGFAALQSRKPREARSALQRVRLNAAQSNKALLGFGWAAADLNDPKLALVPWTELAGRPASDAAVLEAQIAVPYALAEIGAYGAALAQYGRATTTFARERGNLDDTITAIRSGALVRALVEHNPGAPDAGLGAFGGISQLPDSSVLPQGAQLASLMAGNEFQEAFKNLRDLQFLQGNLARWQGNLATFADMQDNRARAFAERLPLVRARSGAIDLPALRQRHAALAQDLARAEEHAYAAAFSNPQERGLQERIDRAQALLPKLGSAPEAADAAERLRRASGALVWQLARAMPERSWAARKSLRDTTLALEAAQARDASLLKAQRDEPAHQARFGARINALAARLQALQPRVAALGAEVSGQLQEAAVAELDRQKERLDLYAAQARLAMAQIHDRAQLTRRSGEAR